MTMKKKKCILRMPPQSLGHELLGEDGPGRRKQPLLACAVLCSAARGAAMADEAAFTGFVTAGSKKAVRPSAAPFDPFADDAAPAPTSGALFQTAGARRPVRAAGISAAVDQLVWRRLQREQPSLLRALPPLPPRRALPPRSLAAARSAATAALLPRLGRREAPLPAMAALRSSPSAR